MLLGMRGSRILEDFLSVSTASCVLFSAFAVTFSGRACNCCACDVGALIITDIILGAP